VGSTRRRPAAARRPSCASAPGMRTSVALPATWCSPAAPSEMKSGTGELDHRSVRRCWGWTRLGSGDHRPLACPRPGAALEKLAADRGITISQLAIAWTLANPAVHVAIVGARQARHVEDSLAAADITLSAADLADIDTIMATTDTTTAVTTTAVTTAAVAAIGPSPESV